MHMLSLLYLDPASGSLILQLAIGGLVTVAAATRMYWRKIRSLFSRDRKTPEENSHMTASTTQ